MHETQCQLSQNLEVIVKRVPAHDEERKEAASTVPLRRDEKVLRTRTIKKIRLSERGEARESLEWALRSDPARVLPTKRYKAVYLAVRLPP